MNVVKAQAKPPTVEAVQFTKDLAEAAAREDDQRFPAARKKEWRDFQDFTADDPDDASKGTWLSVIDPHADPQYGRFGVYHAPSDTYKPLYVDSWIVRDDRTDVLDVLSDDEFQAHYNANTNSTTQSKTAGGAK